MVIASGGRRNLPEVSSTETLARCVSNPEAASGLSSRGFSRHCNSTAGPGAAAAELGAGGGGEAAGAPDVAGEGWRRQRVWYTDTSCSGPATVVPIYVSRKPPKGATKWKTLHSQSSGQKSAMEEKGGRRLGLTYSRVEGEGYEKPKSHFKKHKAFAKPW